MKNKIFVWSITAALAGFLFGFDTVVISGADQQLQDIWGSSDVFHGIVVMGMALWGTVFGAFFGSLPTDKWGRKNTLVLIGVLYSISALGSAFSNNPFLFAFFRFLGGVGIGVSTIAAPAFISEIAKAENRGKLVSLYQFNIVLGILIAFLSNYLLRNAGQNAWRWMLGVEVFPAAVYTLLALTLPESPRWLISKGKNIKALELIKRIYPDVNAEAVVSEFEEVASRQDASDHIFKKQHRFPLVLAFLIAFFNQFSGINAFLYYAPRIFEEAGIDKSGALLSSVGIGLVNLIFTLLGVFLIDKLGRRKLMYIGSIGYIFSLTLVSMAFFFKWQGFFVPVFLFIFIAAHAIGQGAVIWVFISEIFPNQLRASGQAFGSSVHWILAAIIPSAIPFLFNSIGPGVVFLIFALMMFLQLLFVRFMMPETKGIRLEELSEKLNRK
ncbi:sugar porter family MFS transporter [Namhaeicola litoreus]|uniref:Sugar porter family MFS transporter n=1 Tax=Namhaeicola litoreus TaxID=1052145 RepID=A0ABW3XX13_9FLAO